MNEPQRGTFVHSCLNVFHNNALGGNEGPFLLVEFFDWFSMRTFFAPEMEVGYRRIRASKFSPAGARGISPSELQGDVISDTRASSSFIREKAHIYQEHAIASAIERRGSS
jgi:hypothetical protein